MTGVSLLAGYLVLRSNWRKRQRLCSILSPVVFGSDKFLSDINQCFMVFTLIGLERDQTWQKFHFFRVLIVNTLRLICKCFDPFISIITSFSKRFSTITFPNIGVLIIAHECIYSKFFKFWKYLIIFLLQDCKRIRLIDWQ